MTIQPGEKEMANLGRLLEMARAEDLGEAGDVTSALLPSEAQAVGRFVARQDLIFCGGAFLEAIAAAYDDRLVSVCEVPDGAEVQAGSVLAEWRGPARGMLAGERVALNFLQRLSGVATTTGQYVKAAAGAAAEVYDTRKTTPGWRGLEKYAVRAGGGKNHRYGLYDAVLIKDNHLAILAKAEGGDPMTAIGRELERAAAKLGDYDFVELEVDTLDQFAAALKLPVDIILLDNMPVGDLAKAVTLRNQAAGARSIRLEASGGITLANIGQVAATGVERIAVGALTHSAAAADIALEIEVD